MVQWLRIRLPIHGTRVQSLAQKDPTCRRETDPTSRHCWSALTLEPTLCSERSRHNEKPTRCSWRKPARSNKDPAQPKIHNFLKSREMFFLISSLQTLHLLFLPPTMRDIFKAKAHYWGLNKCKSPECGTEKGAARQPPSYDHIAANINRTSSQCQVLCQVLRTQRWARQKRSLPAWSSQPRVGR